ncbi:MAG: hypothetical protein AAF497_08470 [Planctomycetota bacterium]
MRTILGLLAVSSLAFCPATVTADPISFELQIANPAVSIFRLRNTSPSAQIIDFTGFIGDATHNFDSFSGEMNLVDTEALLTFSLDIGDTVQGGARTEDFAYSFNGFDSSDRFQFQTDLDLDNQNTDTDFRNIYFNNGASPNASFEVFFQSAMGNGSLVLELPDEDLTGDPQSFTYNVAGNIPEPNGAFLIVLGIACLRTRIRETIAAQQNKRSRN